MNNAGFILLITIATVLLCNYLFVPEVHQVWLYGVFAIAATFWFIRWLYLMFIEDFLN